MGWWVSLLVGAHLNRAIGIDAACVGCLLSVLRCGVHVYQLTLAAAKSLANGAVVGTRNEDNLPVDGCVANRIEEIGKRFATCVGSNANQCAELNVAATLSYVVLVIVAVGVGRFFRCAVLSSRRKMQG